MNAEEMSVIAEITKISDSAYRFIGESLKKLSGDNIEIYYFFAAIKIVVAKGLNDVIATFGEEPAREMFGILIKSFDEFRNETEQEDRRES